MKFAYLILAHKHPDQLLRLINALDHPEDSFFIHVDKKSKLEDFTNRILNRPLKNNTIHRADVSNVHFIKNRVKVYWGSHTVVQATINSMREICQSNIPFDYLVLLSGQDYPIKQRQYMVNYFTNHEASELMFYWAMPTPIWSDGGMKRLKRYHFKFIENKFLRTGLKLASQLLPDRKLPAGIRPYGGSTWVILTKSCVQHILDFVDKNSRFVNFYKYTINTAELFFQTIILNSSYATKVIDYELTYTVWTPLASNPKILGVEDFENMAKCESFFARKFDIKYDSEVLDLIDRRLLNRS